LEVRNGLDLSPIIAEGPDPRTPNKRPSGLHFPHDQREHGSGGGAGGLGSDVQNERQEFDFTQQVVSDCHSGVEVRFGEFEVGVLAEGVAEEDNRSADEGVAGSHSDQTTEEYDECCPDCLGEAIVYCVFEIVDCHYCHLTCFSLLFTISLFFFGCLFFVQDFWIFNFWLGILIMVNFIIIVVCVLC
jgi:hypothetical protein